MKVIRLGMFETNSSSTHTMVIMSESEFDKWEKGEILKYKWNDTFVSKEESENIINQLKQDCAKKYNVDENEISYLIYENEEYEEKIPLTYEEFNDWKDLECDINYYTTNSGEKLVILCWFGNEY